MLDSVAVKHQLSLASASLFLHDLMHAGCSAEIRHQCMQCWAVDTTLRQVKVAKSQRGFFPWCTGSYLSFSVSLYDFLCCFIPHLACYIYKHIVVCNINVFSKLFLS